jgi:hypothetical protein
LASLPGVRAVATTNQLRHKTVTPSCFDTVGLRIARGRGFLPSDARGTTRVVVINQALVRSHFRQRTFDALIAISLAPQRSRCR